MIDTDNIFSNLLLQRIQRDFPEHAIQHIIEFILLYEIKKDLNISDTDYLNCLNYHAIILNYEQHKTLGQQSSSKLKSNYQIIINEIKTKITHLILHVESYKLTDTLSIKNPQLSSFVQVLINQFHLPDYPLSIPEVNVDNDAFLASAKRFEERRAKRKMRNPANKNTIVKKMLCKAKDFLNYVPHLIIPVFKVQARSQWTLNLDLTL